jgi:hypothetical protein
MSHLLFFRPTTTATRFSNVFNQQQQRRLLAGGHHATSDSSSSSGSKVSFTNEVGLGSVLGVVLGVVWMTVSLLLLLFKNILVWTIHN